MINYILLALSTIMATGKALFCKVVGMGTRTKKETMVLNFESFFVAFICSVFFVINKLNFLFEISWYSLILAVVFGASVALTQVTQSKAMGNGPSSIVTLIYSCGFVLPIICGLFFWQETVSIWQWIGVVVLILSLILVIGKKEEAKSGKVWIIFAFIAMFGSGLNAILQKTHQYSAFAEELPFFLVYALFFSTVFTGISALFVKSDEPNEKEKITGKRFFLWKVLPPIGLGVCVGVLNFLNLTLAGKIPSVILFPVYNVGSMLLTSLISVILFKDKITRNQTIGFFIGIFAILVIGLL